MVAQLRFSKLSLLSHKERRAFQISLSADKILITAGNGFGKSALLKSLYDTLGAKPHKIDQSWRDASVTSLLEFSIANRNLRALKVGDSYMVYDDQGKLLINTTQVSKQLAPFFADLLDFKLVLTSRRDEIAIPPPSFAFAPFYVDQDQSWQKPWTSFSDLSMFPSAGKTLAEYHSGQRPNAFYEAKAERDSLKIEQSKVDSERKAVDQAIGKLRATMAPLTFDLSLIDFNIETEKLLAECQALHEEEVEHRTGLAALAEEHQLWTEQMAIVRAALAEMDETFAGALAEPIDVECPMCGQHYHNSIADQFELVSDKDDLYHAFFRAREKVVALDLKLRDKRDSIAELERRAASVQGVLRLEKQKVTLQDVVAAEGKNEAERLFKEQLDELDAAHARGLNQITAAETRMKAADSRFHRQNIKGFFIRRLAEFSERLDVRLPPVKTITLQGLNIGRGSEGPRALAAYYYAFLHTAREFGSSAFCPIVIDAPNQQGQDKAHLEGIIDFLMENAPTGSQVIIASEASTASTSVYEQEVSWRKDQVLREDRYEQVAADISPLLRQAPLF